MTAGEAEADADVEDGEALVGGGAGLSQRLVEQLEKLLVAGAFAAGGGEAVVVPLRREGQRALRDHGVGEEDQRELDLAVLLAEGDVAAGDAGQDLELFLDLGAGLGVVDGRSPLDAADAVEAADRLEERFTMGDETGGHDGGGLTGG